jgi:hypothetical protein
MATKQHAEWLEKDGEKGLFHADDVLAAKADGWKKKEGLRANGEPWNPDPVEGESFQLDLTAQSLKANSEAKAKKDAKKVKADKK